MASSPPAPETVDLARSFRFVLDDPEWLKKILIGGAFTLASTFIVGIFFVAGYWARVVKRVAAGHAVPLPEWDDLGGIFEDGLPIVGVYFVHVLGVLVLLGGFGCAGGLFVFGLGGLGGGSHDAVGALGALGVAGLYVLLLLVGLALNIYLPAAFVRVALRGEFKVAFDWRANLAFIRANPANYALSLIVSLVAHFVAQVGILLCCVGIFPCAFWAHLILAFALAETVRLNPHSV